MNPIPFVSGAYAGPSKKVNAQECVNLYPVIDQNGGKVPVYLESSPGLTPYLSLNAGEVRALYAFDGDLWAVSGDRVYCGGSAVTTLTTSTGKVHIADNGLQLCLTDGEKTYVGTRSGLTEVSTAPSGPVVDLDGYFIATKPGTGRFFLSAIRDGLTWDVLDFATAEADPDDALGLVSSNRELWIIGEKTTEVWYNSGDPAFPFARVSGAIQQIGCSAPDSIAEENGIIAWLDDQRRVVARTSGYGVQPIGTDQLHYWISTYSTVSDAVGFFVSWGGHPWYHLTFPTAGVTWVFDFATGFWHQRQSDGGAFRGNCAAYLAPYHYIGDRTNGRVYLVDRNETLDNGLPILRRRSTIAYHADRHRVMHYKIEVELDLDMNYEGGVTLYRSDDYGLHWVSCGTKTLPAGVNMNQRYKWNRLGSSRGRLYRLETDSDGVIAVVGAWAQIERAGH